MFFPFKTSLKVRMSLSTMESQTINFNGRKVIHWISMWSKNYERHRTAARSFVDTLKTIEKVHVMGRPIGDWKCLCSGEPYHKTHWFWVITFVCESQPPDACCVWSHLTTNAVVWQLRQTKHGATTSHSTPSGARKMWYSGRICAKESVSLGCTSISFAMENNQWPILRQLCGPLNRGLENKTTTFR